MPIAFSTVFAWVADGVTICTGSDHQFAPFIVSDGSGGAIITWIDEVDFLESSLYAQRVDAFGNLQWIVEGVAIITETVWLQEGDFTVVSDGSSGAIITWSDSRYIGCCLKSSHRAQRVDGSGSVQWAANGVEICNLPGGGAYPTIISDGSSGAIITWQDYRGSNSDIYAQRVDDNGDTLWTKDGIAICTASNDQLSPTIVSDGSSGAIITWQDKRGSNFDIYAQRVDDNGNTLWTKDGVAICTASDHQFVPFIVSDEVGGAIIAWTDSRSGDRDIYAQRVDGSGSVQWTPNGVAICTASNDKGWPTIVSDEVGGAIIAWDDSRSGDWDIYAQRVDGSGSVQWAANGVEICNVPGGGADHAIISDGSSGAIITWKDYRGASQYNIYAQLVDGSGNVQWTPNGVAICTASNDQVYPTIVSDEVGGAIIAWDDSRSGDRDIYAQHVDSDGNPTPTGIEYTAPTSRQSLELLQNIPNPFNPRTTITYTVPRAGLVNLKIYDVQGHSVKTIVNEYKSASEYTTTWGGRDNNGIEVSAGIYFVRLEARGQVRTRKVVLLR
jgi:hypothetical protein